LLPEGAARGLIGTGAASICALWIDHRPIF
jgi:hypothetical protein